MHDDWVFFRSSGTEKQLCNGWTRHLPATSPSPLVRSPPHPLLVQENSDNQVSRNGNCINFVRMRLLARSRLIKSYPRSHVCVRRSSSTPAKARLNVPLDYSTHPLLHQSTSSLLRSSPEYPQESKTSRLNLFQAINSALAHALRTDEGVLLFGEDVAFGGVFRCSMNLATEFGSERVFNTPLTEQGIVGFAIGCAAQGMKPVAEIQFADYVYPAFDQLVNEAAKYRYREGSTGGNAGGLVVRMPCGGVGHGAM